RGDGLDERPRAGRARRPRRSRRHRLGQHVPRPRPDRAVRRHRHQRHRPRGRRLRSRLLQRPRDPADPGGNHRVSVLEAVDLENDVFAERIPHETFQLLRREAPVHWYDWREGKGFWCVTKHADLIAVHKDTQTFSSETGATALEDLDEEQLRVRKSMLDTDPPAHSRLRGLVSDPFTPRTVRTYEAALRELTQIVLDRALPL